MTISFSKRLKLITIAAALFAISVFCGCQPGTDNKFSFIFMTDIHLEHEGLAKTGFAQAIKHGNLLDPDFVIVGGDLIADALGQTFGRADSLYKLYNETIKSSNIPIYNTMGNHEVFGLYERSGIKADHPEYGKQMFKNRVGDGRTYRSFDHKGWHFMLLDGIGLAEDREYYGYIDEKQMTWIKQDLEKLDESTPIVISIHIPFYSISAQISKNPTAGNSRGIVITNANDVLNLFKDFNLQLVLSGHLHWSEEIIFRGVHHINVAAVSGAWWQGPNRGFPEGFAVIEINDTDFTWRYEDYGWHALEEQN